MKLKLGIDFDNTIVIYDQLFYDLALKKNLIPESISKDKFSVRKFLVDSNKEDEFTNLQAEVYGDKILGAKPAEGIFESLISLVETGFDISIISHKTLYPYAGEKYNLHLSALAWLESNKFLSNDVLPLSKDNIFFEPTKEKKVERIKTEGCTHFVDDLSSILDLIEGNIVKIHYTNDSIKSNYLQFQSWVNIKDFLIKEAEKYHD